MELKKLEKNKKQREYRRATGNSCTRKYEKTKKGFLMRCYRNMQSRVTGVQKEKHHLYKGKELLERQEFYEWALNSKDFHRLFAIWEFFGYDRKLTPSVDRVDSSQGYKVSNMEWVTHSENSRRGNRSRNSKAFFPG
jgi:hypothetical protein